MKKILIALLIILILGAVAYFLLIKKESDQKYKTEKITKGDIVSTVTATGTVNAVTTVLVGTQVSGTVSRIFADFNSPVKSGKLIAQIDPTTFEALVDQAKANLVAAKANLEKSDTALTDTKRSAERSRELFRKNLIARSDLDTAETNYESAKAQVGVSRAQVAQSDAALKVAETNLKYTRIISPVDGIVVSRNVDIGQTVAASFQTPTLFTIAKDLTKMQIDSSVVEADIGRIKVDMPVDFTVDAYPDTTFRGKVSEVRISPITVQNVVTYDVVVQVANPELKLMPGMTANVSIIVSSRTDVLKVPNAALRFKLAEQRKTQGKGQKERPQGQTQEQKQGQKQAKRGGAVWVLEGNVPQRTKVETGISDGNFTEIISGDLREGQEVITESSLSKPKNPSAPTPRMF